MLGCVAAVISNCIFGAIYYHPSLPSGKVWLRRVFPGKSMADINNKSALGFSVVVNIMMVLLLRFILISSNTNNKDNEDNSNCNKNKNNDEDDDDDDKNKDTFSAVSVMDGFKFGVGLWCLTTLLEFPHVLLAQRSVDVFLIEQGHNFISMALSGVCIAYFK
ncbi:hypothetical protein PoB_005231200 [Plakobranchus ocellatus]|uniref:7TM GPCR serpentine receptor class x (Srx) domain-containing protein n=1 Tax=Plakobranchus ocellatus TaxID=259542 RepID=A0AAV4C370_9GAST|nr:hypothetical protein PoB_005231200 [Plakobranchus ocellatus]